MTNLSDFSKQLADTVEKVSQSIVTVQATRPISGSVVGENLVLTAAHVLRGDEVSLTTPDGRTLSASVVGSDPVSDLALLWAEGLNMPALSAAPTPRVGELLLAVGRPPHGPQVSLGLMQREQQRKRGWMGSGAKPFPGVSGGALVSADGELVGVLNAGVRGGKLVAVTAEQALKVSEYLSTTGRVPRGYLGIGTQPVHFPETRPETQPEARPEEQSNEQGNDPRFDPRGPFARGEWGHDRGSKHHKPERHERDECRRERWEQRAAQMSERFGERWGEHFRGHFGERSEQHGFGPGEFGPERRGGKGHDPRQRGSFPFGPVGDFGAGERPHSGRLGLTVVQLEEGSPAASAGLKVGDVLLALDGEGVRHPAELLARVSERAGETLTARILRGGEEQDLSVTVGER